MGDLFKKSMRGNIFDPMIHQWGIGTFDSSRPGKRGEFKGIYKAGNMTRRQRQEFRAREAAKNPEGTGLGASTALTSTYS